MWGKSYTQYINIKNIRCLLSQKLAARMQPTSTSPPWLRLIKTCLEQDTKPSARFLQLATLTAEGHPSCRTVVFRGWYHPPPSPSHNQSYIALKAVTDIRSHKINGIRKNPWAEICWYFEQSRQQFRLTGNIRLVDFEEQDSGLIHARIDQWRALSDSARQQFCLAAPGKEIYTETSDIPSHVKLSYTDPHPSFVLMLLEPTTVDVVDLRASSRRMFLRGLQKWSDYYVNP